MVPYPIQSHYSDTRPVFHGSYFMLSARQAATATVFKVFGMTPLGIEPTTFHTQVDILPNRPESCGLCFNMFFQCPKLK